LVARIYARAATRSSLILTLVAVTSPISASCVKITKDPAQRDRLRLT